MAGSAHPHDIVNPIIIDDITPSSVAALSDPHAPDKIVVKFQALPPGETNLRTFLFYVDPFDATVLLESLSKRLKGPAS
ncbi:MULTISPECIES: hypothetical protein [unclassified Bradyrhizobium]|uniref:hypothetical protein n=1 Tax=unclassified Bradyrhizobium TaxID=2631580 RepID=UPI00041D872E|nr:MULTISPECIES: hypothetical protein [unclassified Bradyrhizobium]QIG96190.1 hypothetical protein G6P99_29860 [Bradyrhizobium sp. 6(2017)]